MYFPHYTPAWLHHLVPRLEWQIKHAPERTVYLTFDDGPIPTVSEFVLDTLAAYRVKATFFCVGDNIRKHPHIFERILSEGHRVGNHTFNHLDGWKHRKDDYLKNIALCQQYINQYGAKLSEQKPLFRPPYGKIPLGIINSLSEQYRIVMWQVLSGDFHPAVSPEQCLRASLQHTRTGSIIVMHDSHKAYPKLVYTLPRFIESLQELGYSLQTL
jgi:peptidoglycan/xylan/chitin deacetylase (PgdA/CDA1 family)